MQLLMLWKKLERVKDCGIVQKTILGSYPGQGSMEGCVEFYSLIDLNPGKVVAEKQANTLALDRIVVAIFNQCCCVTKLGT